MNTMRIGEAASTLNISASTLRKYADKGLVEYLTTPNGQRVFTQEALDRFMGKEESTVTVFYTRSSSGSQALLDSQAESLTRAYGEPVRVYSDKGSGLNENRRGLGRLLDAAEKGEFTHIAVTQKDRLTRFGYSYLERMLKNHNVSITVLGDEAEKTLNEELMRDFMSLLASFSGKFYRLRGYEQQKLLLAKAEGEISAKEAH